MTINLEAIYEDGIFRPLYAQRIPLADGTKVRMTVATAVENALPTELHLAAKVYEGLSKDEVHQIEQIATGA
ncbi:antitoxin AF2212-like protein [Aeoliella sp. SH292]|uniref:antitoxin AF2212-like protein n=1 Tax=Aeoliella sp. SH292 TaxID=3454464 RepID=UPI003F9664CB